MSKTLKVSFVVSLCLVLLIAAVGFAKTVAQLDGEGISVEVDSSTSMTVFLVKPDGTRVQLTEKPTIPNPWSRWTPENTASPVLSSLSGHVRLGTDASNEAAVDDFEFVEAKNEKNVITWFGRGDRLTVTGYSPSLDLTRIIVIETAYGHPGMVSVQSKYRYDGEGSLEIYKFVENNYKIVGEPLPKVIPDKVEAPLWSWQGSAIRWGADHLLPVYDRMGTGVASPPEAKKPHNRDLVARNNNFWSTNGGVPFLDFYSLKGGIGIGSAMPYFLWGMEMPVKGSGIEGKHDTAYTWIGWPGRVLESGVLTEVGTSIVVAHEGDFFNGLKIYSDAMKKHAHCDIPLESLPDWAWAPHWETWGYTEGFYPEIVLAMIPELKELGIKSITLDAGWYQRDHISGEGMYGVDPKKYERVGGFKAFIDALHAEGFKVLGWAMGSVARLDPETLTSILMEQHPDWFISESPDSLVPASMTGYFPTRDCYDLCLGNPEVLDAYTTFIVDRFIREYDLDGFKFDSVWGTQLCHALGHGHDDDPEASIKNWSEFYRLIYEKAKAIKPDVMIINCSCGTVMPYYQYNSSNWPIPGDVVGARALRYWVKAYKAMYTPDWPVLSDHLQRTFSGSGDAPIRWDSIFGTGTVLDTKYITEKYGPINERASREVRMTYPGDEDYGTTRYKFDEFQKWFGLYNEMQLSRGEFIGDLYVYGFDYPEAYVIKKDDAMHYAFYTTNNSLEEFRQGKYTPIIDPWEEVYQGSIELRGLEEGKLYRVIDYVNGVDYGLVVGPTARLDVEFTNSLLLKAYPVR